MANLQDISRDVGQLQATIEPLAQQLLSAASTRIAARATGTYMRNTGPTGRRARIDTGPLRIVSGRLARSLTGSRFGSTASQFQAGDFTVQVGGRFARAPRPVQTNLTGASEGINRIERVRAGRWRLTKGSLVPYAAIHEYGGQIRITAQMRRYFWARHYEAEGFARLFWQRMALTRKQYITIPERAYLRPALRDELPEIQRLAGEALTATVHKTLKTD